MSPSMFFGRVVIPTTGLFLAAFLFWQALRNVNAGPEPIEPRIVSKPGERTGRIAAEGRVVAYPGAKVTVGTEVLGTIVSMPAVEKLAVRKGDLLVELRSDEVRASLREAHARLIEAEADLRFEQERIRLDRIFPALAGRTLVPSGSRQDLSAATARRDAARAAIERLEAEAARYRILAPIDGVVVACHSTMGATVNASAPLVTIVDLNRLRVEAEIDEFDIGRILPGAQATIGAEGYPGRGWSGEVEEIADVVQGRQTRPEDPARPSDTRVLPVRVKLKETTPFKLGQRVEVEINGLDRDP